VSRRDWAGLAGIEVVSGAAEDDDGDGFHGFVTVRALADDGSHMAGQLDPATVRKMALNFLSAAESAEQDAVVLTMLVGDLELEHSRAGAFVARMRQVRHEIHPDEDDLA
jgi:hypothetical protein